MPTSKCFPAGKLFKFLTLNLITDICKCALTVDFGNCSFAEPTLCTFLILLLLFTGASEMVGMCFAGIAKDFVALGAVNPV